MTKVTSYTFVSFLPDNEKHYGDKTDYASEDSFPASDPPAMAGITGVGAPEKTHAEEEHNEQDNP